MVAPIPKTKTQEILEQIGVFGRKDASEFKIHRWKTQAKYLESNNFSESKRLLAIIAIYENDYKTAYKNFELALNREPDNGLVYSNYSQALLMEGRGEEALEYLVKTFIFDPSLSTLERFLSTSMSFLNLDLVPKIVSIIEKYNVNKEYYLSLIENTVGNIKNSLKFLDQINASLKYFRLMMNINNSILYKEFYTQTQHGTYVHDNLFSVVTYPQKLSKDDISELNDMFIENIVQLDIPYDELLKLSFYFSGDIDTQEKEVA